MGNTNYAALKGLSLCNGNGASIHKDLFHKDSYEFLMLMQQHPDLSKYQKRLRAEAANLDNLAKCMPEESALSNVYTPSLIDQMRLPAANLYNPIQELVTITKPDDNNGGGFYHLPNVLKTPGEPDFYDIWLLTDRIDDPEQRKII